MRQPIVTITANVPFSVDHRRILRAAVRAALKFEGVDFLTETEVVVVDGAQIRALNAEQRGIDRVTDVLSFPCYDDPKTEGMPEGEAGAVFLGSMVLCFEKAVAQAKEFGHSLTREIAFLTVHSVLHLLGYDHETGEEDQKEMFARQEEVLRQMGIGRGE